MLMEAKVPTQAQFISHSRTELTPIISALTAMILLVLTSVALGPVLLPGITVEQQYWLVGP